MNFIEAGIFRRYFHRWSKCTWSSAVMPSQTLGYPSPQSDGSIFEMFCGRFVSSNQSNPSHSPIRANRSSRQAEGTLLSNTSAIDAQNTRGRCPWSRLNAPASLFHLTGSFQLVSDVRFRGACGPHVPPFHLRKAFCVGPVVALTYRATVDVPARFRHSKSVGSVFGLTPSKYQSGEINRTGAISKCGDEMMRVMLYEAAQVMLTRTIKWSWLKAWAMKIARHRGMKKAIVALARRLAVIMHRIWVDGTEFRWTRDVATA